MVKLKSRGGSRTVFLVEPFLTRGGEEQHVIDLATTLSRRGWSVYLTTPTALSDSRLDTSNIHTVNLDIRRGVSTIIALRRLWLRLGRPIMHSHGMRAGLVARLATLHRRHNIWTAHLTGLDAFQATPRPFNSLYMAIHRGLCNHLTFAVCAVSDTVRDALVREGISPGLIRTIPNGVTFPEAVEDQISRTTMTFAVAGRLSSEKQFAVFIHAFAIVSKELPDARAWVAGDGPELATLKALVDQYGLRGRCVFLGHVTLDEAFWGGVDVLCLPSRSEGRSLVLLEAMSRAKACIASDIPANASVLHPDRGRIVPVADVSALSEAMSQLANNPTDRAVMGARARDWIRMHASHEAMVDQIEDVYSTLQ